MTAIPRIRIFRAGSGSTDERGLLRARRLDAACASSPTAWAGTTAAKSPRKLAVEGVTEYIRASGGEPRLAVRVRRDAVGSGEHAAHGDLHRQPDRFSTPRPKRRDLSGHGDDDRRRRSSTTTRWRLRMSATAGCISSPPAALRLLTRGRLVGAEPERAHQRARIAAQVDVHMAEEPIDGASSSSCSTDGVHGVDRRPDAAGPGRRPAIIRRPSPTGWSRRR